MFLRAQHHAKQKAASKLARRIIQFYLREASKPQVNIPKWSAGTHLCCIQHSPALIKSPLKPTIRLCQDKWGGLNVFFFHSANIFSYQLNQKNRTPAETSSSISPDPIEHEGNPASQCTATSCSEAMEAQKAPAVCRSACSFTCTFNLRQSRRSRLGGMYFLSGLFWGNMVSHWCTS